MAEDMRVFRIGTGGIGGTYYPVGGLIAQAIGAPAGARDCRELEYCGVPGLVAVAQSANGSVANVEAVAAGLLESGFSQSDVAYWAYTGSGIFGNERSYPDLRAIAGLYPETVHLVARRDARISTIADLKGKRVSLDEPGSGTLVDARLVLQAYGLSESDFEPEYIKPELASERIQAGDLDAFFIVAGHPVTSVRHLAHSTDVMIVPIAGEGRKALLDRHRFFSPAVIEPGVYRGVGETPTIAVHAIWITRSDIDDELIYNITRALWSDSSRKLLDAGHVKGREITRENALSGIAIPLHPGAERYYRDQGLIP
jgi:uncharacterized protein